MRHQADKKCEETKQRNRSLGQSCITFCHVHLHVLRLAQWPQLEPSQTEPEGTWLMVILPGEYKLPLFSPRLPLLQHLTAGFIPNWNVQHGCLRKWCAPTGSSRPKPSPQWSFQKGKTMETTRVDSCRLWLKVLQVQAKLPRGTHCGHGVRHQQITLRWQSQGDPGMVTSRYHGTVVVTSGRVPHPCGQVATIVGWLY